ncbi:uncharacterized protein LOC133844974 isoform X1 [Drosophila sulfurigaster albostrigata]|uniref:uncharacterized protein LOC133844974 isoform X1 n=1 Tax=Drosophila sulfurigaster albostrigata TaxID=89887 RepID=UPI002D21B9B5|nr:uncharacterized protein LOC133844974 isoform X1 [Drosophila sulfurigaster albostrigata]
MQFILLLIVTCIVLSFLPISSGRALPAADSPSELNTTQLKTFSISHKARREDDSRNYIEMPMEFDTLHMPCDMDSLKLEVLMPYMPNHCIWLYNQRYQDENFYRYFKLAQLESFFFGQYFERYRRFEVDQHIF